MPEFIFIDFLLTGDITEIGMSELVLGLEVIAGVGISIALGVAGADALAYIFLRVTILGAVAGFFITPFLSIVAMSTLFPWWLAGIIFGPIALAFCFALWQLLVGGGGGGGG